MLDLNEVAMFTEVVRAGSFAQAARTLGMPSNTLSRHIQKLETALGARLLQRTTRKLTLTSAGQRLHEQIAGPMRELFQATLGLQDDVQGPSGCVRVAAVADLFEFFSMGAVADFLAAHPKLKLEFVLSDEPTDLLAHGIDVAFRGGVLKDSSLVARRLGDLSFVFAASPAYLARRGTPRRFQDLADHDCITGSRPGRVVWAVDSDQGGETLEVKGRLGANTARAQMLAACAGLGVGFLPEALIASSLASGALQRVLPQCAKSMGNLYVVFPSRKQVPRGVTAFVDFVVTQLT